MENEVCESFMAFDGFDVGSRYVQAVTITLFWLLSQAINQHQDKRTPHHWADGVNRSHHIASSPVTL